MGEDGTATVSATPVPFWTRAPGGGRRGDDRPGGAGLCCSTRSSPDRQAELREQRSAPGPPAPRRSPARRRCGVATTSGDRCSLVDDVAARPAPARARCRRGPASVSRSRDQPELQPGGGERRRAPLRASGRRARARRCPSSRRARAGTAARAASARCRSTGVAVSRATRRPVFAASVAVPPKRPASRTSARALARSRRSRSPRRCARRRRTPAGAGRAASGRPRLRAAAPGRRQPGVVPSATWVRPARPGSRASRRPTSSRAPAGQRLLEREHDVALERVPVALLEGGVDGVVDERPRAGPRGRVAAEQPELAQRAGRLPGPIEACACSLPVAGS